MVYAGFNQAENRPTAGKSIVTVAIVRSRSCATHIEFKKPFKFKAINKLSISLFYVTCTRKRNQYITFAKMASLPRSDLYCVSQRKARPVLLQVCFNK